MFYIRKAFKDPKMYHRYTYDKQAFATLTQFEEIELYSDSRGTGKSCLRR